MTFLGPVLSRSDLQLNYTLIKRSVYCSFFLYDRNDPTDEEAAPAHRVVHETARLGLVPPEL